LGQFNLLRIYMDRRSNAEYPAGLVTDDRIALVPIANTILRSWRIIAVLPAILALMVGLWTLSQDRTYSTSASFIPQGPEVRGMSGTSALAEQLGLNLRPDRSGESPQFYVDILRSLAILRQAVESEYEVPEADGSIKLATLIELYEVDERGAIPAWRKATDRLRDDMATSVARETGVVRLTISAAHPWLSEQIAQRLLELLHEFNLKARQSRAQEESRFISGRVAEAQEELLTAERALEEFLRGNWQFRNSPELVFDHDRLQRQVIMRQEVYTALLRSQEQARIDAVRDTPVLTVIDSPIGAAQPEGRGTVQRVMLAFIFGLMIGFLAAFIGEFVRRGREASNPHYREFHGLARQAWEDMRRPNRWLRGSEKKPVAAGDH
jgi:uncharacterized protein involved in exopolysaccharide biosynthesis